MQEHRTALVVWGLVALGATAAAASAGARPSGLTERLNVWVHAHNCYPDEGIGADRLARALAVRRGTIAIEQDLVWDAARQQSVVSHDLELSGTEPTLDDHFFRALAPELDRALAEAATATWPRIVLHLDFKTNEPAHHAAIWRLLGRYERWLTTAPREASGAVQPLTRGPLLVLTEDGAGQEHAFNDRVPVGGRLRVFGTVPGPVVPDTLTPEARAAAAVRASPQALIPTGATNYRRWTNHAWAVVEQGGPRLAQDWLAADRERLDALVARAHALGLWIRFYTLNGHALDGDGWSDGYNFGSLLAVTPRWRAAIDAGVDFIATDQYEAFSDARRAHERR